MGVDGLALLDKWLLKMSAFIWRIDEVFFFFWMATETIYDTTRYPTGDG
jgi:hypothetical protein